MKIRNKVAATAGIAVLVSATMPSSSAMADGIRNRQWHLSSLAMPQAHAVTTGAGITVGVIDTGTYPHPDIRRNLSSGSDQTSSRGNGQIDADGHGTGIAALIAGHGGPNKSGIQGIAPSAKILPVRVSKSGFNIESSVIAKGVNWAVGRDADVINVSLSSGPGFDLQDAVNKALDKDIVVVAGAGNTSSGAIIGYPAAMDGVLAVGATGRDGKYASLSIKDPRVQLCAPGVDITSAKPRDKYGAASGTSDSAAIVSGAAALVRAKFPRLSGEDVVHRLTATADDIGPPGRDDECGFGRLNIVKALTADVPPIGGAATTAPSAPVPAVTTSAAAPSPGAAPPERSSGSSPLLWGGLVGIVLAGGLVAIFALRRRRV